MEDREFYKIIGVSHKASDNELKKAYHKVIKQFHPDINKNTNEDFIAISVKYDEIKKKRQKRNEKINSIKNIIFSGGNKKAENKKAEKKQSASQKNNTETEKKTEPKSKSEKKPERGTNIDAYIELTVPETVFGCTKRIVIKKSVLCNCNDDKCKKCNGTGRYNKKITMEINIPAAKKGEQTLRISGKGNEGNMKGCNGDLILHTKIKDDTFKIKDRDVYIQQYITFPEAVKGTTRKVPTIYGEYNLKIPPCTVSKPVLKILGMGIDTLSGKGDEYVVIKVKVPKVKITQEIEDLLTEIEKKLYTDTNNQQFN